MRGRCGGNLHHTVTAKRASLYSIDRPCYVVSSTDTYYPQVLDRRRFMTIFDQIFETISQGFLFTLGAALFFIFGIASGFFDGF